MAFHVNKITVNAREHIVWQSEVSFEDVCFLAQSPRSATVTFKNALGDKTEGCLSKGQTVRIQDGTRFSAVVTDNA